MSKILTQPCETASRHPAYGSAGLCHSAIALVRRAGGLERKTSGQQEETPEYSSGVKHLPSRSHDWVLSQPPAPPQNKTEGTKPAN